MLDRDKTCTSPLSLQRRGRPAFAWHNGVGCQGRTVIKHSYGENCTGTCAQLVHTELTYFPSKETYIHSKETIVLSKETFIDAGCQGRMVIKHSYGGNCAGTCAQLVPTNFTCFHLKETHIFTQKRRVFTQKRRIWRRYCGTFAHLFHTKCNHSKETYIYSKET